MSTRGQGRVFVESNLALYLDAKLTPPLFLTLSAPPMNSVLDFRHNDPQSPNSKSSGCACRQRRPTVNRRVECDTMTFILYSLNVGVVLHEWIRLSMRHRTLRSENAKEVSEPFVSFGGLVSRADKHDWTIEQINR